MMATMDLARWHAYYSQPVPEGADNPSPAAPSGTDDSVSSVSEGSTMLWTPTEPEPEPEPSVPDIPENPEPEAAVTTTRRRKVTT